MSSVASITDNTSEVKEFYNKYFTKPINFTANQVDSVTGFFEKRGFDKAAAVAISTIILQQAHVEKTPVHSILDTLKGLEDIQLSKLVTTILNVNRSKSSGLGSKIAPENISKEQRNIIL
jgi:rubrerythrin|tara:strand:- start:1118 stop:1477 length:360 start_codon:yes stop_codon:yes gene_type:complete